MARLNPAQGGSEVMMSTYFTGSWSSVKSRKGTSLKYFKQYASFVANALLHDAIHSGLFPRAFVVPRTLPPTSGIICPCVYVIGDVCPKTPS